MLNLVVLYVRDLERAKDFYSLLGLDFTAEQHGRGPRHYACRTGDVVLEIYPAAGAETSPGVRLGFQVPSVDETIARLRTFDIEVLREPADSLWGRRAVIRDPDGYKIELSERERVDGVGLASSASKPPPVS